MALIACTGGGDDDDVQEGGDQGAIESGPASAELQAGAPGSVEHESGARMAIPLGATTESVTVAITEVDAPESPVEVGKVFDFSLGDAQLRAPVTLHIPFEIADEAADASEVVALHWDDELSVWEVLEGEVDTERGTVAVTVSDLSFFSTAIATIASLLADDPAVIEPEVLAVDVPDSVVLGQTFNVNSASETWVTTGSTRSMGAATSGCQCLRLRDERRTSKRRCRSSRPVEPLVHVQFGELPCVRPAPARGSLCR